MQFDIVIYNKHFLVKRALFLFMYVVLLAIYINSKCLEYINYSYLKWGLIITVIIWIVYSEVFKVHTVVGELFIKDDEIIVKQRLERHFKIIDIKDFTFYYGGYKGKMYELDMLLSGSWWRDGTRNILRLSNDMSNAYQIRIKNQEQFLFLQSFCFQLKQKGIDSKFINLGYRRFTKYLKHE